MGSQDAYGLVSPDAVTLQRFSQPSRPNARYRFEIGTKAAVTPYANWNYQVPWETPDPAERVLLHEDGAAAARGAWFAEYSPIDKPAPCCSASRATPDLASLNDQQLAGFQTQFIDAQGNAHNSVSYDNLAAYAQILWDNADRRPSRWAGASSGTARSGRTLLRASRW